LQTFAPHCDYNNSGEGQSFFQPARINFCIALSGRKDTIMEAVEEIEVFLQGRGISQIALVQLPADSRVRDIINAARPHGLQVVEDEEVLIWIEGEDEPLHLELTLTEAGIRKHSRVHVHNCHTVQVAVTFNGQSKTRHFSPAQTIEKVKQWADHEFELSQADATDHVLQVSGTTDQPSEEVHVGALVHYPDCSIGFDLVPKSRVQG
jgi:hypothetical protein